MKAKEKKNVREIAKMLQGLDEESLVLIKHGAMVLECKKQIESSNATKESEKK